ncbi:MAG: class I SAM-dependent methyltransferase [Candidatus Thorarchaeota archaeon]|nr:class I SAM-dependent methyltransferase [Candidatus Thorarchaeota archaeon]
MERIERGWDDFWAEVFRVKHRQSIQGIQQYDQLVVDFCIEVLGLKKGNRVLDIACGAGDQDIIFAKRKLKVSGFDLSSTLIKVAKEKARTAGVEVDFYTGDMRTMSTDSPFDAAVILSHSFGFFDHEENLKVLEGSFGVLSEGGRLLLDLMNPYNLPRFYKTWTSMEGGYLLNEPHSIDATAGVLRGRPATFIDTENSMIVEMSGDAMSNNDIRMYTSHEIQSMLHDVGFRKTEFYGQNKLPRMPYAANSERMVVIATR